MKQIKFLIIFALAILFVQCNKADDDALRQKAKLSGLRVLPNVMPGSENDTPALVTLGKKLYNEKALSKNNSQSCASCHSIAVGGDDPRNTATSQGAFGKFGDRNSPTVLNAGFYFSQFWDGRAKNLAEQAKGPILNPVEMAMTSEKEVVEKINNLGSYNEEFAKAFPDDDASLSYENIATAIAAFERTFITQDRFDAYLDGNNNSLNKKEKEGLELFIDTGCTSCHTGVAIGGSTFQKMGVFHAYEDTKDMGRYAVTKEEKDKFLFKVPSLRNIADTSPYFHDGKVSALEEAVTKMAYMQLNKQLQKGEVEKIIAFLHSLSGKLKTN